jgi:DNA replicative helicase MCM subunit Mcm2 (Cdc46/Mcm family)
VTTAIWKCDYCGEQTQRKINKIMEPPVKPKQCADCGNTYNFEELHNYINAATLQIQDDVPQTGLDSLQVIAFDKDTQDIHVGETVKIIGEIEKVQDRRSRKYHSVLLAESIEYEHRKKLVLTHNDIESIKRFAGKQSVYDKGSSRVAYLINHKYRLVKMFAPNVIGHEDKKLALLLSLIGAPEINGNRGRIHELLIGPPGLGKTKLGKELIRARRNSRYVSGKNTTGKSLTGMVLKEEDSYILNLGPVPLAKNAVCVINEFDKMDPEEQDNLLDVMEEGEFTVNKFAKLRTISSPTTIIATANPKNNKWKDPDSISLDEVPFEAIILSRFDIVLVFRDTREEDVNREFAYRKTEYDEKHLHHNYNFLEKYIEYAKTISPLITEEAISILNEYWVRLKKKEEFAPTIRTLESIHRISKAFARLHLCNRVDTKIAYETIDFMNNMLKEFEISIYQIKDSRSLAYDETIKLIQQQKAPIELIEAIQMVCQKNDQVNHYIGNVFKQNKNKKLKLLCNKIIENRSIIRTQHNPMVVQWMDGNTSKNENNGSSYLSDLSDLSDPHFRGLQIQNNGNISNYDDKNANLDRNTPITYGNSVVAAKDNDRSQGSQGSLQDNDGEEKKKQQILGPDTK